MSSRIMILFLCLLSACCKPGEREMFNAARTHAEKLRMHFMGNRMGDISTLIAETQEISQYLKRMGKYKLANKFDSYIDVLSYGNNTIEESVRDVFDLVYKGVDDELDTCCIPNLIPR